MVAATNMSYTTMHTDCLAATDSLSKASKNHACVVRFTTILGVTLVAWLLLVSKRLSEVGYFLTDLIFIFQLIFSVMNSYPV